MEGLEGVAAWRGEKEIFGANRTVVVTRSESFLSEQLVGLAQTRRRVEVQLAELVRLCDGHRHKMDRARLAARVDEALARRKKWHFGPFRPSVCLSSQGDVGCKGTGVSQEAE